MSFCLLFACPFLALLKVFKTPFTEIIQTVPSFNLPCCICELVSSWPIIWFEAYLHTTTQGSSAVWLVFSLDL